MFRRLAYFLLRHRAVLYSSKIFIASLLCWYGLKLCGVANPLWSVITVFVVSDPSLTATLGLAKVRVINTLVGCVFGLTTILTFGYSPLIAITAAALTVFFVTMLPRYPLNWRLAPVTVIILMDAGRLAVTQTEEFTFVMSRVLEICLGCAVAMVLAGLYTRLALYLSRNDPSFEVKFRAAEGQDQL